MTTSPNLAASVAPQEVKHFSDHAQDWWSPDGIFSSLHDLTAPRVRYIDTQCEAFLGTKNNFEDLSILDMGCGGGLISESLAAKGAHVTGVDASQAAIEVAKAHAADNKLDIDYKVGTAEDMAEKGVQYDLVLALEIVEHVADLKAFMAALTHLVRPGGIVIFSTLNRTRKSFLFSIMGAEYMMGKVPVGTHDYEKFIKPHELAAACEAVDLPPVDVTGLVFRPLRRVFELQKGKNGINYFLTAKKL